MKARRSPEALAKHLLARHNIADIEDHLAISTLVLFKSLSPGAPIDEGLSEHPQAAQEPIEV